MNLWNLMRNWVVLPVLAAWLSLAPLAAENAETLRPSPFAAVVGRVSNSHQHATTNRTGSRHRDVKKAPVPAVASDDENWTLPIQRNQPVFAMQGGPSPTSAEPTVQRPPRDGTPASAEGEERTAGTRKAGSDSLNSTTTHRETVYRNMPSLIPDPRLQAISEPEGAPAPVVEIEPEYVKALTPITSGHNDSNPIWSPSGKFIAFERSIGDKREIIIARAVNGEEIQKIYYRSEPEEEQTDFFFPEIVEDVSYNSGITWSPDEKSLVFMSNGGSGNYDLYLQATLGQDEAVRLTDNEEKDSHPHWSPGGPQLVFVSGRTGKADIYLMDLVEGRVTQLTTGDKTYLYPRWSPDGQKVAMIYGSNENHDVYVINDMQRPSESMQALTTWSYDDLRPVWSPDGTKIAFYSNFNPHNDPKIWSLIVIAADGSDATEGDRLAAKVVATNVIPDIERGPAWLMDSRRIVYVKNDEYAYNPIYIADVIAGSNRPLKTETKMNHDVICSTAGLLAFRAQIEQWDHIYIAKLKP